MSSARRSDLSWATLIARLILGLIFFMAGVWKVFTLGPLEHARRLFVEPYAESFLPAWSLWTTGTVIPVVELTAGALVILGLFTRPALLALGAVLVAVTFGHLLDEPLYQPGATAFTPFVFDSYPASHSLLMLLVWGFVLMAIARAAGVEKRAAWLIMALVASHWVLDWVTHAPDIQLWPGSAKFGLELWNSIPGTFAVESMMWLVALGLYLQHRHAKNWKAGLAFWSFVVVTTAMWAAGPYGPPPPNERALAWFALIGWVAVPWAGMADRGYAREKNRSA